MGFGFTLLAAQEAVRALEFSSTAARFRQPE